MQVAFKPNPRARAQFREALSEYARLVKKDDPEGLQRLMSQSGRRFVRNVADITPPASGKADTSARKAGENAVLRDLLKIAIPVAGLTRTQARATLATAADLIAAHGQSRGAGGRVNGRNRREKLLVDQSQFVQAAKTVQGRVGWLAAGLNAAARKLGIRLPSWIARHGEAFGSIDVEFSSRRLLIRVVQNVPYATRAGDYVRKWNYAFEREVQTLKKMLAAVARKAHDRARRRFR